MAAHGGRKSVEVFLEFLVLRVVENMFAQIPKEPDSVGVLGIILAGGKGDRLWPLTKDRAKPAVKFGGKYRIIDFVLSNFVNSGIHSIYVLTQYKAQSLMRHLELGWRL